MKLYYVRDGDEIDRHFSSKAEAIRFAKETDRDAREQILETNARWGSEASPEHGWKCRVTLVTLPPLTQKLLLNVLNDEGYVLTQTIIWPPALAGRDPGDL